jgi:cation diffusion facilitator CzcD-associated flavoprotein CzcO
VGAGPAGLATAAMLGRAGISSIIVEKRGAPGATWREHYERLHLHTVRRLSGLPGMAIPRSAGRWVSKEDLANYLETYARRHRLEVRTWTEVFRIGRSDRQWLLETSEGPMLAELVVVATGFNREPVIPSWPGREGFTGELIHSSRYRNARPYIGRDVLVVGTGNSGAEIAVDLAEGGARRVWLSFRTPPNILRREVGGVPTQAIGILMRRLPVPLVDGLTAVVQRATIPDLGEFGLPRPSRGMYRRLLEDDLIPVLDVGLIEAVRRRDVTPVAALTAFVGAEVVLEDDRRLRPHAVVAATGFRRGLEPLVGELGVLGPGGRPVVHGGQTHPNAPGLYFIGYTNPLSGNLRELGIDAKRIARAIAGAAKRSD